MLLTRYGQREWTMITALGAGGAAAALLFIPWLWLGGTVAAVLGLAWLGGLMFFRDPIRFVPKDLPPGTMLSPADGVVSAVEHVDDHSATNGPAVIVRIFLSLLNVHVNRAPFDGEVTDLVHTPGEFLNAQTEESARVNESNLITLRIDTGGGLEEMIGVRQVSGMIARTIVCPLKVGDRLTRGQKFGMIKFGSTTELILPRPGDVEVHVRKGDKVKAGLTRLATISPLTIERVEIETTATIER